MPKSKNPRKASEITKSSGNVFDDIGLSDPGERLAKAQLAMRICEVIASRRLTQTEAAKLMSLDQPKISALKQGRLAGFSIDRLFRCLNDLGQDVRITVQPVHGDQPASTRILLTS